MCVLLGGGHLALCTYLVVPLGPLGWFVSLALVRHAQLWCPVVVVVVVVVLVVVGFLEGVFALWWGWGGGMVVGKVRWAVVGVCLGFPFPLCFPFLGWCVGGVGAVCRG